MTGAAYLVRVQNHSGALERVLSTLRRKYLGVESISVFPGPQGVYEVLLRISPSGSSSDRITAELKNVVDVREVQSLGGSGDLETRELAVVRVPPGSGPFLTDRGRLLSQHHDGDILEITGSPHEVDAALTDLANRDVLTGFHRTGGIPTPQGLPYRKGEEGE